MDLTIGKLLTSWELFLAHPVTHIAVAVLGVSVIAGVISVILYIRKDNRIYDKIQKLSAQITKLQGESPDGKKKRNLSKSVQDKISSLEVEIEKLRLEAPDRPQSVVFLAIAAALSVVTLVGCQLTMLGEYNDDKRTAMQEKVSSEIERVYGITTRPGDISELLTGNSYSLTETKFLQQGDLSLLDNTKYDKIFKKYHDSVLMLPNGKLANVTLIRIADEYKLVFSDNKINEVEYTELDVAGGNK